MPINWRCGCFLYKVSPLIEKNGEKGGLRWLLGQHGLPKTIKEKDGSCFFLFYLAIAGKASLESFILQPIRENICISLAANGIIVVYLYQNITEL